ncbi:MAG: TraR/DksA C4-type zinc finger protein [Desulfohalobiaceae bacterium]
MADAADRAQVENAIWIKSNLDKYSQKLTPGIESALECQVCGQDIPQARREAVPGCRLCVRCQEEQDG